MAVDAQDRHGVVIACRSDGRGNAGLLDRDLDRQGAINIMKRSLDEFVIEPVKTTIPLYRRIMDDPSFCRGDFDTGFINRFVPEEDEDDDDD